MHFKSTARPTRILSRTGLPCGKTYFCTTYEGFRQSRGNATVATVPSLAQRSGDFSQNLLTATTGADALGRTYRRGQIFDPRSTTAVTDSIGRPRFVRDPFPGN